MAGTRADLAKTRADLASTSAQLDKALGDNIELHTELSSTQDQLRNTTAQLFDAQREAKSQQFRGDAAVTAAQDMANCMGNIAQNSTAIISGNYGGITWNDAMKAQCDRAIDEVKALTPIDSGTTL